LGYQHTEEDNQEKMGRGHQYPSFSSLNEFFVKEGEDFPFCDFQEPWRNRDRNNLPGWEIFYEEDLYLKENVIYSFSTKLTIGPREENKDEEDEEEEMTGDLFDVMALENDEPRDDPVHLIHADPDYQEKGKKVKL